MIRVLILADTATARAGLEAILRSDPRFEPVRSEAGVASLTRLSGASGPACDVVLMELADKRRLAAVTSVALVNVPAVMLADDLSRSEMLRALNSGVRAVLPRDATPAEMRAAVEAASAGLVTIDPDDLDLLIPAIASDEDVATEALSTREAEVLALMAQGLANKNIADRLHISEHTVKFHVSSILAKLGATSRTEAVTRGVKDGLLLL